MGPILKIYFACLFLVFTQTALAQDADNQFIDSTGLFGLLQSELVGFQSATTAQEQEEIRAEVLALLAQIERSELDPETKALAYQNSYRIWDKRRDKTTYLNVLRGLKRWTSLENAPQLFFANYQMGNAFIFNSEYDSAAYYLQIAYRIDQQEDIGKYEGAVEDRIAVILSELEEHEFSLQFSLAALEKSNGRLRAAVYNQLGNTYTILGQYQEAALAYDSAVMLFEGMGRANWKPLFNSMTAYLELEGQQEKFFKAYDRVKTETSLLDYPEYSHKVELAKAEFTMAYWRDTNRYDPANFKGMVLPQTPENEREVRRILGNELWYSRDWSDRRDAWNFLRRFYELARPDSVPYALNKLLELNETYEQELASRAPEANSSDAFNPESAFGRLIIDLGLEELDRNEAEYEISEKVIRRIRIQAIIYMGLLLLAFFGLYRAWIGRRQRRKTIATSERLQRKEEKLLQDILPEQYHKTLSGTHTMKSKRHNDVIVLVADFSGFTDFSQKAPVEDLIRFLKEFFDRFEVDCVHFGLEKLKTDGDSFIAVGGVNDDYVSPRQALNAALAMQRTATEINQELKRYDLELSLRIGIDIGPVDAGIVGNHSLVYDMWGEVFDRAKTLETDCPVGQILMSKRTFDAETTGTKWPMNEQVEVEGIEARLFIPSGS